ncbi:hypothetical protein [Nocardia otitidiscaviarum]|uniref:hypothetical protein n=1 Tax=Nocardia otitidiscaviarum TaxID=1823 RepID=UPI0024581782|nr:hypothetical protein [Nocardia otitidiscaviarum]
MTAGAKVRDAERAEQCAAEIVHALAQADPVALARLDPKNLRTVASGRAAWQVLAGAAIGQRFRGRLHAGPGAEDPSYFVASWIRA